MGVYIDLAYYRDIYHGEDATDDELTKLITRATDDINAKTGWQIDDIDEYIDPQLELIKKSTAAQVEWYVLNGETYNDETAGSVSLSKYSYSGTSSSKNNLCRRADMFLSQTGLTNRAVYYG